MKKIHVLLLAFLFLPSLAMAGTYQLRPDLKVILPEVVNPWEVSTEPSAEFLEHLATHIMEEAKGRGHKLPEKHARQVALIRARNYQLFVVNTDSGAHLLISFSPLKEGKPAPSAGTVAQSAKSAAGGFAEHGWEVKSTHFAVTAIKGAQVAQWFAVDYAHEDKPNLFMGIVGFAHPYWFWFYGNDHLEDAKDQKFLERLILGTEVQVDQE